MEEQLTAASLGGLQEEGAAPDVEEQLTAATWGSIREEGQAQLTAAAESGGQ